MNKFSFVLFVLPLMFVGCVKDDSVGDNGKNDKDGGKKTITMTATINEVDYDDTWSYEGVNDDGNEFVGAISELGEDLLYFFTTEDQNNDDYILYIALVRREGSTARIQNKEYGLDDPDFYLRATLYYQSNPHTSYTGGEQYEGYKEERVYNGETVTQFARLKVLKSEASNIEAEFEFDAYTPGLRDDARKATVRNGKIKGKGIGNWK